MSDTAPAKASKKAAATNWYYDASAKQASGDFLDSTRFFQWDAPADNPFACPERDGVQVNAIPVPDQGVFPAEILEVAARVAQK